MAQHVIIFDGPDGCGKTNIATELSKQLGVPYFKNKREAKYFENDPGYFIKALKYGDPYFCSYLQQTHASVILDRSFPSEWAYSQAFGRETNMDMLRMVDGLYAGIGAKIIIPYRSSYAEVNDVFKAIDEPALVKLDGLYREFVKWTTCDVKMICVDDEDLGREMAEIIPFVHGLDYHYKDHQKVEK